MAFVELLSRERCPRLQCVFLNGCGTLRPLGETIFEVRALSPTLTCSP